MNPIVIWRIIAAVGCLFGVGGLAYGVDQHQERRKEQSANRARLQRIEAQLNSNEQKLAALRVKLGEKNEQVRILAGEVARLRSTANDLRRSA